VLLFLHVYKTGGTSSRELFEQWSETGGLRYAQAGSCLEGDWMTSLPANNTEYICLEPNGTPRFPTPRASQRGIVSHRLDVIAGHFAWGFHRFIERPVRYVTCLRNPLSRFVSDILYAHRFSESNANTTLEMAVAFVEGIIAKPEGQPYRGIYPAKLSGEVPERATEGLEPTDKERRATSNAIRHLQQSFAVVGQIEVYAVFVELVAALLDPLPGRVQDALWNQAKSYHSNKHEGFDQSDVIPRLSGEAMTKLNTTLALDWQIYVAGCRVTLRQCYQTNAKRLGRLRREDCDAVRTMCHLPKSDAD
jgi:hypothetical protein